MDNEAVIEFLKNKESFSVGGLRLGIEDDQDMYVTGWSQYKTLKSLTKQTAINELLEIKQLFNEMIGISYELQEFIKDKNIRYNLAFDYGMGSIGICHEKEGVIKWETELVG